MKENWPESDSWGEGVFPVAEYQVQDRLSWRGVRKAG
jgi:hypothetical protein